MEHALHFLQAARQCEIKELEQLYATCQLVKVLAELIHALQKERGLSSIVLSSQGQRGTAALHHHYQDCDQSIAHVQQALHALDVSAWPGGQGARLCSHIALVLQGLQALTGLRHVISDQRIDTATSTQSYIRLIHELLAVVFEAADSATDPRISRLLVAMFHLMQGKELAGQERATGAAAFNAGCSENARQQHWLHLIEAQERCFQVFEECAPEALIQQRRSLCAQGSSITLLERLRRIGCTTADGRSLDPEYCQPWFEACTQIIDGLHQIELQLAETLAQECQAQLQQAKASPAPLPAAPMADHTTPGALPAFFAADPHHMPEWSPPLQKSMLHVVQEQSQRLQAMRHELDDVRQALTERKTIERAKGILMTHQRLSESEAHKLLRQTAMQQNRRLVDVAQAVLAMSDLLSQPATAPA